MRKVLVATAAAFLALAATSHIARAQDATLKGCWVETSVAGTFLRTGPREATGSIGGGCDLTLDKLVVGAGIRADFGDDIKAGALFGKLGLAINPSTHVYALVSWNVPDWKVKDAGQLHLGLGAETQFMLKGFSLFSEATTAVSKFGPAATRDDIQVRVGARYRF